MNVTVLFFAGIREKTGTKEVVLNFKSSSITLLDIVKTLLLKYPSLQQIFFPKISRNEIDEYLGKEAEFLLTQVKFAKNRKIIAKPTHEVHFTNGDTLAIFLPLLGG